MDLDGQDGGLGASPCPGGSSRRSILVVDDEPQVLEFLGRLLKRAGYDVRLACDGRQALEEFRRVPADLLITDLFMPEQEGVETITQLRRERQSVKIVAMSGMAGAPYLRMCEMLGADAVLAKPFPPERLLETVRDLMGRPGAPG